MVNITQFFYTFDVSPQNEKKFAKYMENYGTPIMSKFCKNWHFFKQERVLTGENGEVPQYIGYFEIENIEDFLKNEPPTEMIETIEQASKVCSNTKEWVGEQIATNSN